MIGLEQSPGGKGTWKKSGWTVRWWAVILVSVLGCGGGPGSVDGWSPPSSTSSPGIPPGQRKDVAPFSSRALPHRVRLSSTHPNCGDRLREDLPRPPRPMKQDPFARSCLALLASVAIWWGTSGVLPAEAQPPVAEAVTTTATPQEPQRIPGSIPSGSKYWSIMGGESASDKVQANEALLDHAVGTINTMFYDNTGGAYFSPRDFYSQWRSFQRVAASSGEGPTQLTGLRCR